MQNKVLDIYSPELIYMIMKAKKSHHLLWVTGDSEELVDSEPSGLRIGKVYDINPSQEQKNDVPDQSEKQEGNEHSLLQLFVLLRPSVDCIMPTHTRKDNLMSPPTQMLISCRNTLIDTPEIMFNLGIYGMVEMTQKINSRNRQNLYELKISLQSFSLHSPHILFCCTDKIKIFLLDFSIQDGKVGRHCTCLLSWPH